MQIEIIFKNKKVMNLRVSLLSVVILTMSVFAVAQTSRNPLNYEPASVMLKIGNSSWKLSEEAFFRADGLEIDKRVFAYDNDERKLSHTTSLWNARESVWQNSLKNDIVYEENKTVSISSVGYMTGWQNSLKVETIKDAAGKQIYSLSYTWNNSNEAWSVNPSLKSEWSYNEDGRVVEYLKIRRDKETGEWTAFESRILYYYKEGKLAEELFQSWNKESQLWENRGKYVYSNESGTQKTATSYYYASDNAVLDGKIVYIYDGDGKLARSDFYGNNQDKTLSAYCLYTYTENKSPASYVSEDITVYPNPVVSSFELTVPTAFVGKTANIFDVFGAFVKSVVVSGEKTQVNVNGLSKGVYVLQVADKTKKLIIK